MKTSVLLVEDEKTLLPLLQRYLERAGYSVTGCLSAEAAFAAASAPGWAANVLVADHALTGISGTELAIDLLRRYPNLRCLLCSGFPLEQTLLPEDVRPRVQVLQKPFLPAMLAASIADLLAVNRGR